MTNEEKRMNPKTRKKVTWWKSFTINEDEKLGGKSGNIEEGNFLSVWENDIDKHKSLTTSREIIRNKNDSK